MQHLLPFSQGLSRAASAPQPGPACQSRQSRWRVVSWHTPPCGQGLSGRMLPPGRLEEPWAPAGLCELSSSNLIRGSAPLEIALQRGVSLEAALWPPSFGSGLEWLQVLDAGVCEGDSDGSGSRMETEPPGREPGSAGPCCRARARAPPAHQFSWVYPGQTSIWLSPSLFIRGVNNPYIVFLLLDYFVFV